MWRKARNERMKTASYISTQTATGGAGKYPLSTQALDFIQSQILLLQNLSLIGGNRYILKAPDGTSTGCVVIDGEVFTLPSSPALTAATKYIIVKTEKEDIEADGETYMEARTIRTAYLSQSKSGAEAYEVSQFNDFATNTTLSAQIKQMPSTVLRYIQDVLNEKLSSLTIKGLTQSQLDSLRTPCLVSCENSLLLFGCNNYAIVVKCMGATIQQELVLPDGSRYVRVATATGAWGAWAKETENLHIEVKIAKGVVYLRHGQLPTGTKIVLLRKKKRSKFRRTGGAHAYAANRGKRVMRQPKTQYVHYKGIILSQGEPNKWYVPKCTAVADQAADGNLIDRELPTLCAPLIKQIASLDDGIARYKAQGVRNIITTRNGKGNQKKAFVEIAVQAALSASAGSKDAGGEMVRMKYRLSRKRNKVDNSITWIRSFSMA